MIYYRLENFFKKQADIAARDEQGLVKDKIYFSCFRNKIEKEFSHSEIKTAIKNGWLREAYINTDTQILKVYMWLDIELKQRRLLPSLIETIKNFVIEYIVSPLMRIFEKD